MKNIRDIVCETYNNEAKLLQDVLRDIRDCAESHKNNVDNEVKTKQAENKNDISQQLYRFTGKVTPLEINEENIGSLNNDITYFVNPEKIDDVEKNISRIKDEKEKIEKNIKLNNQKKECFFLPSEPSFVETVETLAKYMNSFNLADNKENEDLFKWCALNAEDIKNLKLSAQKYLNNIDNELQKSKEELDKIKTEEYILSRSKEFSALCKEFGIIIDNEILDWQKYLEKNKTEGKNNEVKEKYEVSVLLNDIVTVISEWIKEELEIERLKKESEAKNKIYAEQLKTIKDIEKIVKKETGKDSVLQIMNDIPEDELDKIVKTMNSILAYFHFRSDFLPIKIRIEKKAGKRDYKIKADGKELDYNSLSTGQKTQLSICWSIGLNYAYTHQMNHRIMLFDDITTSLDMSQLLPASILFRKMAYADNEKMKRQVILTSHHEDLTNRMIDYLRPPKGKTMKIISFNDYGDKKEPEEFFLKGKEYDIDKIKECLEPSSTNTCDRN